MNKIFVWFMVVQGAIVFYSFTMTGEKKKLSKEVMVWTLYIFELSYHGYARGEENSLFLLHRFWLVELFWMIYDVNNVACLHLLAESSVSCCEEISNYFSNKITQIQTDMLVPVLANSWLGIVKALVLLQLMWSGVSDGILNFFSAQFYLYSCII